MKKVFLFLSFCLFSSELLAQGYSDQGILKEFAMQESEGLMHDSQRKFTNRLVAEVSFYDNYQTTNRQDEYKDTAGRARLFSNLNFTEKFSLNSYIIGERVDNAGETARRSALSNGGGDRTFENSALYFQELNFSYNSKDYALVAGKFNLDFGNAWMWNKGIWIQDIANNYRQTEKIGFSGLYRIGDAKKTGQYNLGFSIFSNDSKNLDNSILVERDSTHRYDGTPGDTRSLQSFNATLNVNFDFGEREKLTYHFSYLELALRKKFSPIAANKSDSQKSFVAGMDYQYPASENVVIDGLIEYAQNTNLGGNSDVSENYFTANLITKFYRNWNILIGNSTRRHHEVTQFGFTQNLTEISLGYEFNKTSFFDKLTLQAGYKNQRNNNQTSLDTQNVFGVLLRYYKNF